MNEKNRQNGISRGFRREKCLMRASMMVTFALLLMLMLAGTTFGAETSNDGDVWNEGSEYMESDVGSGLAEDRAETADSASLAEDDEGAEPESAGSGNNDEEGGKGGSDSGGNEAEADEDNGGNAARTDERGEADKTEGVAGQDDEGTDEEGDSDDSAETKVTTTAAKTGGLSNLGTPKTGDSFPLVCILIFAASLTLIGIVACRVLQRRGMVS